MDFNRELSECVIILYGGNKEFEDFADIITKIHVDNNKLFNQISPEIFELNKNAENWENFFSPIKVSLIF